MKRIIWGFCIAATAAWAINLGVNPPPMNAKALSHEILYFNGLLAWGFMAMAVVIAARPAWLEKVTGTPLDELYRWHKFLGIAAAVLTVIHYFSKTLFGPIVRALASSTAPKAAAVELAGFDAFWAGLRSFAVTSSEIAVYAGAVLLILSFVGSVRYSRWLASHRLFAVLFLVLAVHSIRLMDPADALTPFGLLNIAVTAAGAYYAAVILVRGAGHQKTIPAVVTAVDHRAGLSQITVRPVRPLSVRHGEFAFLVADGREKHPFSIAEISGDGTISFAVKHRGDYTSSVVPALAEGDEVVVEGPWGHFLPDFSTDRQLWLAGGVGIAPFCAWLQEAAAHTHGGIRLVWCIRSKEGEPMFEKVEKLAREARVTLEVVESKKKRLDAGSLFVKGTPDTLALCAGAGLSAVVTKAYAAAGGRADRIRREHFNWR